MDDSIDLRQRLIQEGMRELSESGVQGVSLRRIAQNCGVSCAAPYKHFQDKQALLLAVANAFNEKWRQCQQRAVAEVAHCDAAAQIRAVCKAYLLFLRDNPAFCALITQKDEKSGKWQPDQLFDGSTVTKRLIVQYAAEHGLSEEETYCRTYAIRAIFYGVSTMNQLGGQHLTDSVLNWMFNLLDSQI